MNKYKKLEYQELRSEFSILTQIITSTVNYSVLGTIAIFSFIFTQSVVSFWLYALPILVIYPSCLILISRFQSLFRIASYLIVFIEPNSELKFENRLLKLNTKFKLRFRRTILLVYLGLILIDILVFISKGFISCNYWIFYSLSVILFIPVIFFMYRDWKRIFIENWEKVKLDEEALQKKNRN